MMTEVADVGSNLTRTDLERKILAESEEGAREYLLQTWFYHAMEAVHAARLRNDLTQAEIAEKMGTTQSAVARLENAHSGNFSLDRFLHYAWECGVAPLDLEFAPTHRLRHYALNEPSAPRTAEAFRWRQIFKGVDETATLLSRQSQSLVQTVAQSLQAMLNSTNNISEYLRVASTFELDARQTLAGVRKEVGAVATTPVSPTTMAPVSPVPPGTQSSGRERFGLERAA